MNNYTIKSVIKKIYSIDYKNINLDNNTELIISRKTNDFHQLLFMNNEITNTYMIPHFDTDIKSIQTGLFYKDNSFYNHPIYGEPLISFRLSLTGIKLGSFYRIRFICSGIETFDDMTSSKVYIVLNGKDIIFNTNICPNERSIDYIYRSEASVLNIAVTMGKVNIKDIIFEEVEVVEKVDVQHNVVEIPDLMNLRAYAVLKPNMYVERDKAISKLPLLRGIGLNILYNRDNDLILIERNKENDVILESFALAKYFIDVKTVNGGTVTGQMISETPGPFGGCTGHGWFKLADVTSDTILYILVYELL